MLFIEDFLSRLKTMDIYKTRKTAIVCAHPLCPRLTRRYNNLCVRHRNDAKLIKLFEIKRVAFQKWRDVLIKQEPPTEFEDWEILYV
tara:strand:+ start:1822 stop:2082 length:261 start_codon:yes stop_codon:yes gene_type:complete